MQEEYLGIKIDYDRDSLFSDSGLSRLQQGYMTDVEISPQQRFAFVANEFASNKEHAQRMYDYISQMWISCSTPVLSYGKTKKSLPISCYSTFLDDSLESILDVSTETRMMAVCGGGVGIHVNLRPQDQKSSGIIPHLQTYDADTLAFKQGTSRRGASAAYIDTDHPEIIEFLEMRKPTGGDPNRKCLNLHHGINVSDDFMRRIYELSTNESLTAEEKDTLDKFPLVNKHTNEIVEYISAKELWARILEVRMQTGEPYLFFIDTANDALPEYQKKMGLRVNGSNLCAEISIPTNNERSLVCCLLSINLEHWDKIESNIEQFMLDIVEFLDNVLGVFIQKTENIPELQKARYSAIRGRDIGIGALGWHSLLQSKMIPFESAMAIGLNKKIWKSIKDNALKATVLLAKIRGACPDALTDNIQHRNSKLLALAPNAASSFILNTSPSCEPYKANVFLEKGVNGTITHKIKHLVKLLDEKDLNTQEIWSSIIANDGSVQHLKELSEIEKDVFKTAFEIDQTWIINQAADRQEHICQSQSTNIFFTPTERIEVIHWVHLLAWKNKMKSLYYCRSDSLRKSDKVGEKIIREKIVGLSELVKQDEVCLACQ